MSQKKTEDYLELLEFLLLKMAHISIEPEEGSLSQIVERCKKCSEKLNQIINALEALNGFSFLLNKNMEVEK
ncbi:MAG: hypothetical protein WAV31_01280 [Candidatus Moraniibacteriota bacterium]